MPLAINNLIGFGSAAAGGSAPTFVSAGTGATNTASNTLSISYPSGIQANDIIVVAVVGEDASGVSTGDTTFSGADGVTNFTEWNSNDGTGGKSAGHFGWKRATGSESGSETASMASPGGTRAMTGIMYLFRGAITTGDPADAFASDFQAASTTWNQKSLTTTGSNELAVHIIAAIANSATAGSFTGETGGDFTETNIYSAANGTIQLQTSAAASATTISGGTVTASGSGAFYRASFGLKPP